MSRKQRAAILGGMQNEIARDPFAAREKLAGMLAGSEDLRKRIDKALEGSKLVGTVPPDGAKYGIRTGSKEEWSAYLGALAQRESSGDTATVGDKGKFGGHGSRGLFQLSPDDAVNYGLQTVPFSYEQLHDADTNIGAAVKIHEKRLAGGKGMEQELGKYWGPIARGWTPAENGVDAADVLDLMGSADRAIRAKQSEATRQIQDQITADVKGMTEADVRNLAGSVRLGATDVQELLDYRTQLAARRAADAAFDWGSAGEFDKEIEGYDPAKDKDGKIYQGLLRKYELLTAGESVDAVKTKGVWGRKLSYKHPMGARGADGSSLDADKGALRLFDDFVKMAHEAGAFGNVTMPVEETVVKKGPKGDLKETKVVQKANPVTQREYVIAKHGMEKEFRDAIASGEVNANDAAAVAAWVNARTAARKAVGALPGAVSALPSAGSAPVGGPDAERLRKILGD